MSLDLLAGAAASEPVETLGDTTPGAFDALDHLLPPEHRAVRQALEDCSLPAWWPWAASAVFVITLAVSAIFPWGFATP